MVFAIEIAIHIVHGGDVQRVGDLVLGVPSVSLLATGGNYWSATIHEARVETLLTSVFVHGGLLHIGFNLVALRQIGPFVERTVGPARMLPLYLISGFVASFASTFYNLGLRQKESISVGASGAICGLIGATLVIGWRVEGSRSPIMWAMVRWLGMTLLVGFALRGVDNAAHIGGAIAGVIVALLWRRHVRYSPAGQRAILGACALVLVAAAARLIERDVDSPWALVDAADRREIAINLLRRGDCDGARAAAEAARRLLPKDPKTVDTKRAIDEACR
jgi:rhomboid protease GluP